MSNHNPVALAHIIKLHRPRCSIVDRDRAIHHGGANFDFFVVDSDKGLLICRDIKVVRKNTVGGRRRELRVDSLSHFCAMLKQAKEQLSISASSVGAVTSIFAKLWSIRFLADLDFADLKCRPLGQDLIQHFRQD